MNLVNKSKRRRKYRHLSFNPNREFVAQAMKEYLKEGGKITQLESRTEQERENWVGIDENQDADEFLKDS